jgi:hypothetical protein
MIIPESSKVPLQFTILKRMLLLTTHVKSV